MRTSAATVVFPDSGTYTWSGFATTIRPYGLSLLFDALGRQQALIVFVQTTLTAVSWLWLADESRRWMKGRAGQTVIAGGVLFLSMTDAVVMWDRVVLSESLALATMISAVAWSLRTCRDGATARNVALGAAILVTAALIRESTYAAFVFPSVVFVLVSTIRRQSRVRRVTVLGVVAIGCLLVPMSLHPSKVVFVGKVGATLENFRTMNVIGQRILLDPYLKSTMEKAGMPLASPPVTTPLFAMDEKWRLYAIPGMRSFSDAFPTRRYLLAEASRPGDALRTFVLPALGNDARRTLKDYGLVTRGVPPQINKAVWSWSGWLHVAIYVGALVLATVRRSGARGPRTLLVLSALASLGSIAAFTLDAMERVRHAWPFIVLSRVSLCVAVLWLGLQTLDALLARRSGATEAVLS